MIPNIQNIITKISHTGPDLLSCTIFPVTLMRAALSEVKMCKKLYCPFNGKTTLWCVSMISNTGSWARKCTHEMCTAPRGRYSTVGQVFLNQLCYTFNTRQNHKPVKSVYIAMPLPTAGQGRGAQHHEQYNKALSLWQTWKVGNKTLQL